MGNIKRNLVLQTIYQVLNTCLPLITAPYLSRILGASNLGIFSYTSSVVSYFTLFAMLGTMNYGTRSIAIVQKCQENLNKTFCEIYSLQLCLATVTIASYGGYWILFCTKYKLIALIQIIEIFSCAINIGWLFFGLEKFQITVTRNVIVKVLTVIGILLFVKTADDLWKYVVIMLGGTMISQLSLWIYVPRYVKFVPIKASDVFKHIKPNVALFMPLLAMSVYHTMDKTMLGLISSAEESGFYYNADKLINIPVNIISGVGTVMLPRITALISSEHKEDGVKLFSISLEGTVFVSIAMAFGIAAIAPEFVPFFFGNGYEPCILLCRIMAPVLIIKGFSLTVRTQYMIPFKMEKDYTKSVLVGAVVNVFMNAILIPNYGALGATCGTLAAELSSCIMLFIPVMKQIELKHVFINSFLYTLFAIAMSITVRIVSSIFTMNVIIKIVVEIVTGGIVMLLLSLLFWKKTENRMYDFVVNSMTTKKIRKER